MNWPVTPIGDLVEITQGCPFDSSLFEKQGSLPVVRIRDVVRGRSETYLKGGCEQRYLVSDGDILIGMDGDFNRARWHGGVAALNQRVCRIRANINRLDDNYLYHLLPSRLKKIEDETPFVTVKHLSSKQINSVLIPLPPLSEQRRIAAILDQVDALRKKRRAALARLDEMAHAIFVKVFGDPIANSARYPVVTLGSICDVRDGTHDSPKYVSDGGYPLVTSKNVTKGYVDLTDVNYISEEDYKLINRRSKVDRGDIILPMIGTIGFPVIVEHDPAYAIKNVALIKFKKESPSRHYIHHVLNGSYFDFIIGQQHRGGTQKFVSLGDLRRFPIPLPTHAQQQEFDMSLRAVHNLKASKRRSAVEFDALSSSLQHRAFTGAL